MGSIDGASKTQSGGLGSDGQKPPAIFIFNNCYLNGPGNSMRTLTSTSPFENS